MKKRKEKIEVGTQLDHMHNNALEPPLPSSFVRAIETNVFLRIYI